MYKRSYHNLNFIRIWPEKSFFEGWSWFKFNNLGLALGTNLKFYTSLSKGLKLKVRRFWGLTLAFVEVTGEKMVGGLFAPPSWIGLIRIKLKMFSCKVGLSNFQNGTFEVITIAVMEIALIQVFFFTVGSKQKLKIENTEYSQFFPCNVYKRRS